MDEGRVSEAALEHKIQEYSNFVSQTLRPKLAAAENAIKATEKEICEYRDLAQQLTTNCKDEPLLDRTQKVDLGHGKVFCNALIEHSVRSPENSNEKMIFVHVGMGFHVEMTCSEAIQFTKQRVVYLTTNKLHPRRDDALRVREHIQQSETILDDLSRELARTVSSR
jgi:hypothetical protein